MFMNNTNNTLPAGFIGCLCLQRHCVALTWCHKCQHTKPFLKHATQRVETPFVSRQIIETNYTVCTKYNYNVSPGFNKFSLLLTRDGDI